ncbi:MAG: S9 family peptidase [Phycisphaera sp.]|nr:MAG: S9 family peptidase [Phycisphaera sp.]
MFNRANLVTFTMLAFAGSTYAQPGEPPATEIRTVSESIQGTEIRDDYRWLEGDDSGNMTDELAEWTDSQNDYTRQVLDNIPGRDKLEARLRELMEIPSISTPSMYGDRYFYRTREGDQPQSIVKVRKGLDGEERVLLDPEEIDPSGLTTVSWTAPNPDGSLMAFGMYYAGDENSTLYVMDVETGEWLAEEIPGKVRLDQWLPDSSGFYYSALEDLDDAYSGVTRFHKLGTHHRQDRTLFRQHDLSTFYGDLDYSEEKLTQLATTWGPWIAPSEDGKWALVGYWTGTSGVDLWAADLDHWYETGELNLETVAIGMEGRPGSMDFSEDTLFMQSTIGAPNGRIVAIDMNNPGYDNWTDIIPEDPNLVLQGTGFADGIISVNYLDKAQTSISLYKLDGSPISELELPGIGSAGLSTSDDRTEAFLTFTSYNTPTSIYHIDLAQPNAEPTLWARPDVPVDPDSVIVKQVWYESKDGTPISMFIVHPKNLELDGNNPTILYGYGGFNVSITPSFSSTMFPWFEEGGVYAIANLRGGGEYGAKWHEAGRMENKQNVFDDFIAAGEYLIDNKYTNSDKLGIAGGSNGGLLTGAVMAQRPDLFAAVECHVPLLDMLRYQDFLMARYWVPEYGSAENPEQFETLLAYSPYHNIQKGVEYPAIFLTAGENDTRVHPLHARKMAALVQASTASSPSEKPVILWVDREAGHGGGKSLDQRVRDIADRRIFMMRQLGVITE